MFQSDLFSEKKQQSYRLVGYLESSYIVSNQKTHENLVELEPGNIEDI
jgi:hypothetical protein